MGHTHARTRARTHTHTHQIIGLCLDFVQGPRGDEDIAYPTPYNSPVGLALRHRAGVAVCGPGFTALVPESPAAAARLPCPGPAAARARLQLHA